MDVGVQTLARRRLAKRGSDRCKRETPRRDSWRLGFADMDERETRLRAAPSGGPPWGATVACSAAAGPTLGAEVASAQGVEPEGLGETERVADIPICTAAISGEQLFVFPTPHGVADLHRAIAPLWGIAPRQPAREGPGA